MGNLFSGHTVCPLTDAALPTNGVLSLALEYEFPSSCNSLKKNHSYPSPSTLDAPLFVPPFIVIAAPRPNAMQSRWGVGTLSTPTPVDSKNINSVHAKKNKYIAPHFCSAYKLSK